MGLGRHIWMCGMLFCGHICGCVCQYKGWGLVIHKGVLLLSILV